MYKYMHINTQATIQISFGIIFILIVYSFQKRSDNCIYLQCVYGQREIKRGILKEQDSGIFFFWHTEKVNQREQDRSEKEKMV